MKVALLCGILVALCVVQSVSSKGCSSDTCDADAKPADAKPCKCKTASDCSSGVECVEDAVYPSKCICKCNKDNKESGCTESNLNYLLNLLNAQLRVEYRAMFSYSQLASFCGSTKVAKLGFQKKWLHAAAEEKEHADMITQYINLRGGNADIVGGKTVDLEAFKKDLLEVLENSYSEEINRYINNAKLIFSMDKSQKNSLPIASVRDTVTFAKILEIYVYKKIIKIRQETENYQEFHLADWLDRNLIQEQVDSIYELSVLETRIIVNDTISALLIDQELYK